MIVGKVSNIAVLFTDLVGSTELSVSVSPDAADQLRREHFAVLRRAVAAADGTEIKNLGDGLMVMFPTASAALACAVGMQQATEMDNRGRTSRFGLRVGLSAGEAVEEDGDYFGDPVIEAARLCARCDPGQVLATEVVRLTAGRRSTHRCEPIGELELKGLPGPVATVEVHWEPLEACEPEHRVPLPSRLTARPAAGLVGRSVERAPLLDALKRTAAGDGREVVVVAGEAGLGKTTLVAAVARDAFDAGTCVLFGHAEEGLSTPYGLFAEALGHLVTHAPIEDIDDHVKECGSDLARIVPALTRRLPDCDPPLSGDPETERYLLFASVVGLVRRFAVQRPVLLVLDDLQWADSASLQLLRHLVGEDTGLRLLVLATFRDTEVFAGHPLLDTLADLWRMERVSRLDLRGLDDRAVIDLLEAVAGHSLDDTGVGLAHALHRETDGNPFFVSEVLRNLVETRAIYQDDSGRWVSDDSLDALLLPNSVREVVGARVARLGPQATRVLSSAAVIGRDFDLELLARVTDTDTDVLLDLLEAAEAAAVVRGPVTVAGRFAFTHALVQRTLYEDLSASRRARAHERVAEALEEITSGLPGDRVGELARHWAHATRLTDNSKAVEYAIQAGAAARAALAPAEAVRWYSQALGLEGRDGDPHRRALILLGLGEAQLHAGDPSHRQTLLEAAHLADRVDDVELLTQAALANSRGFMSIGGVDTDRLAIVDRALERLGDGDPATRARLLALSVVERYYVAPLGERLAVAEEAVALTRTSGDLHAQASVAQLVCLPTSVPWTLQRRLGWARDAYAAAEELGSPSVLCDTLTCLRMTLIEGADRDGCDATFAATDRILARLPHAIHTWVRDIHRSWLAVLDGDLELAEQLAERVLTFGSEIGQADSLPVYGVAISGIRDAQGRMAELVPALEERVRTNSVQPAYRALLAFSYTEAGELERCRELLDADRMTGFVTTEDGGWLPAQTFWAKAAIATGDLALAEIVHARIAPFRDQLPFTGLSVAPAAGHIVGRLEHLLGRLDDAAESFANAHRVHRQLRAPQFVARTEVRWAQVLVDRGHERDRGRAGELAEAARRAAIGRPGWEWIERDAAEVLERRT